MATNLSPKKQARPKGKSAAAGVEEAKATRSSTAPAKGGALGRLTENDTTEPGAALAAVPAGPSKLVFLATVGFLVGESGATPLFDGAINGIAINQFWQVPTSFWPVLALFTSVPETFRALRGWKEPTVSENYFVLREGYTPGDIDFDPLGLKPTDAMELKEMQTKELQHGRLAMLAAAGMIVQELQTGNTLF